MTVCSENDVTSARNASVMEVDIDVLGISIEHLVRPINMEYVYELVETDETEWEPLEVRPWPPEWPKETPQVLYHVVSGNHRTSAARLKKRQDGLQKLAIRLIDAPDDQSYLVAAIRTNARHGRNFTEDDRKILAAKLKALGQSSTEIAKLFGVNKSTVNNWLSGRDSNASRKAQKQDMEAERAIISFPLQDTSVPPQQKIMGLLMDAQMKADILQCRTYIQSLNPAQQEVLRQLNAWLQEVLHG